MDRLSDEEDKGRSRFPEGMTERKARASADGVGLGNLTVGDVCVEAYSKGLTVENLI